MRGFKKFITLHLAAILLAITLPTSPASVLADASDTFIPNDGFTVYSQSDSVLVGIPSETVVTSTHTGVAENYNWTCPGGDYRHVNLSTTGASVGVDICNLCGMSHASGIGIGTGGSVGDTYVDIKGEHNVNGYRCTVCGKTWHSASEITNAHAGTVYFYYCSDYGFSYVDYNKQQAPLILYKHTLNLAEGIDCSVAVSRGTDEDISVADKTFKNTKAVAKTDFVYSGRTITYTFSGLAVSAKLKVNVNSVDHIKNAGDTSYSFTMPLTPTTVSINFDKQPQTVTLNDSYSVKYNSESFNLNVTLT